MCSGIIMILIFFIPQLLACEFKFIYNQEVKEVSYNISQAEFIAFGIWTRYYTFYLDIGNETNHLSGVQQIMTGFIDDLAYLEYFLATRGPFHYIQIDQDYMFDLFRDYYTQSIYHPYAGVWMFTYIGIDKKNDQINMFIVNSKTDRHKFQQYSGQTKKIKSIKLFGEDNKTYPFSGQISYSQSQSSFVQFNEGEQLLTYLKTCNMENTCTLNKRYNILQGIMDKFIAPFQFKMQNNYWIDGWFKFTPETQIKNYNNLILQIVQYDQELFSQYNGIIPLKISLSFDKTNLTNNGIIVETSSYEKVEWNDQPLNPIIINIFNDSYLVLQQSWVYFRFLQFEQIGSSAEFYLSFSDSSQVNKQIGQLNLFKYGYFFIYLGQSKLNQNSFIGQLTNFNIQSCLQDYPQAKNNCHSLCLTCIGPLEHECLSCVDQAQANRVLNQNTITCEFRVGFIPDFGKVQCQLFQSVMKSTSFEQFQVEQRSIQQCKQGQFQYQIGQLIKCYVCPQQSSIGILCADCLENIFTWQENMKCSYDYYQENNNNDKTYIKYQRPSNQIEFYYIQDDLLLLCLGCNLDEKSQQIVKGSTILYGKCHQSNKFI